MRYTQIRHWGSLRTRRARFSVRSAVLALLLCSPQSPIVAADGPSVLEEIEATKNARLAAEAALQDLRACVRNSGATQAMEQPAGSWTFDFSLEKIEIQLPFVKAGTSLPCPDIECKVKSAQKQLNDFAAAQIDQHSRLLRQIAKLHERLNNIASCIK